MASWHTWLTHARAKVGQHRRDLSPMPIISIVRGRIFLLRFPQYRHRDTSCPAIPTKQLCLQCASIPDALAKLLSEHAEGLRSSTPVGLLSTIKSVIGSFLDINDWGLGALHLLAPSRHERDIEEAMNPLVSHSVSMDE
ncbi:hypothetical protein JB92DRAFT_157698 [Gautieria morchelliformis]|nr:hypothetical protein JB92DRAFT_157698 [Gautieria morchelliformis]